MIELLHKNKNPLGKVLEIGTGCGYQAAVLSLLADEVYSIERIRPLHDSARAKLRPFRINNLRLIYGDGILGLPQAAPFDAIILAAAGLGIPDALLDQLAIGGRLVAPVARHANAQQLLLIERVSSQRYQRTALDEVFFVPLQSGVI
jgi:protein-L-isoaspartate(D-aspartate) O-methyltransferase